MAFVAQSLADGLVADAVGTIYTAAAPVIVRTFTLYNSNATPQVIDLFVTRSGGVRRQLYQFAIAQYETATVLAGGEIIVLSSGDIIEADTNTASAVAYFIAGAVNA